METVHVTPISYDVKIVHQKIFNKVVSHLLTQLKPSRMPDERESMCTTISMVCSYRGDDGTSCAVGCLIPDELYVPEMEYKMVWGLLDEHEPLFEFFKKEYNVSTEMKSMLVDFLRQLQVIHDNYPAEIWKDRLTELADNYGLEIVA